MKRALILLAFLLPFLLSGQSIVTDSNSKIVISPYRYIADDVSEWTVSSGSFVNGTDGQRNTINCTSDGEMYIKSTQSYGTWEFDFYKGSGSNYMYAYFISNSLSFSFINTYIVAFSSAEELVFLINGSSSGGFKTTTSYISVSTWYSIRITRDLSGVFTTYIKGGSFGNQYVLVDVSGGNGTNPLINNTITNSAYFFINIDEFDKVSNFKFKDSQKSTNTILKSPYRYIPNSISSWTQGTGTYVNGSSGGRNYIECNSDGTAYFESTQAYGTWEYDVYTTGTSLIYFISDQTSVNNGYEFISASNGRVWLRRRDASVTNTLFYTALSYINSSTWYSYRIIRDLTGKLTYYIKGGAFGSNWVLLDITGGAGIMPVTDNTYTTSNYFLIDLDAGDRISNVRFKELGFNSWFMMLMLFSIYYNRKRKNSFVALEYGEWTFDLYSKEELEKSEIL